MVPRINHPSGVSSHSQSGREFEISRFRKWYIDRNFRPVDGFRYDVVIDYDEVNRAVERFLSNGFRYPHYPYSNF